VVYRPPVLRFVSGFLFASLLWGGAAFYYLGSQGAKAPTLEPAPAVAAAEPQPTKRKQGKRRRPGARGEPSAQGTDTFGEDIGWDDEQTVDMAGGEQQLPGSEIEAGFDRAMPGIRRCLVLVPADGEIAGKLLFGMRVGANGTPKAVNLTGPALVTGGESGSCLRRAAESIRFPAFQGPDMVFRYPITLQ
jgi:hypothetical protein